MPLVMLIAAILNIAPVGFNYLNAVQATVVKLFVFTELVMMSSRLLATRLLARVSPLATKSGSSSPLSCAAFSSNAGGGSHGDGSGSRVALVTAGLAAAVGTAALFSNSKESPRRSLMLKADTNVDAEQEVLDKENRIRQFGTLEKIFDFFSTYQYVDNKGEF